MLLKENIEYLPTVKFPTVTYIDLNYDFNGELNVQRKTVGGEYMGSMFGQDVEPKGYYCIEQENTLMADDPHHEFRTVHIQKPIVICTDNDKGVQWKYDLSEMFGGSIGKRLSNKLIRQGFDAIITVDGKGNTWEIVLFK